MPQHYTDALIVATAILVCIAWAIVSGVREDRRKARAEAMRRHPSARRHAHRWEKVTDPEYLGIGAIVAWSCVDCGDIEVLDPTAVY